MIFTEAIRLYCREKNISVRQFAALTGMSQNMSQRFLEGRSINSMSFARLVAWTMQEKQ